MEGAPKNEEGRFHAALVRGISYGLLVWALTFYTGP